MTREDITRMAREAGNGDEEWLILVKHLFKHFAEEFERFANRVAEAEREACADECVRLAIGGGFAADCAAAIRARGQDPMPLFDDWPGGWKK